MKYGYYADRDPEAFEQYPFRCPSWTPMPEGKKNVVILGCSHTWGVGLDEHETWAHKVSQHNKEKLRYWNLGQPGSSPEAVVRMLYRTEKTLHPDLAIIMWPEFSRREWLGEKTLRGGIPTNLMGTDPKLKSQTAETDLQTFLKSVFFTQKFAEHNRVKVFHCFASTYIDLKEHDPSLNVLQDYTLKNCWPHWDKFTARELHTKPSLARDGMHYGEEHHERFAQLFLQKFGQKLR